VPPIRLPAIALAVCTSFAAAAGAEPQRLPEDPAAAAKSTEQWRQFMAAEEHERRLLYDRNHLKDHRAVVKVLVATRARYDRAKSKPAVLAIQKRLPPVVENVRKRIARIDHWGNNSNLLGDYDLMLNALSQSYPAARISFLDGDRAPLDALRAELDRRTRHIEDWLAEAAASKDE
jgi:hypothetical protein